MVVLTLEEIRQFAADKRIAPYPVKNVQAG